ncbi:TPM domain-containing protein [Geodermatophilus sp. SYSU D00700]
MRRAVVVAGAVALVTLVPGPAWAEPPFEMTAQVTDEVGALGAGAAAAQASVEDLGADTDLGLHAVFVSSFDSADAGDWAAGTARLSALEESDVLLAVAVGQDTYEYGWWVDDDFPLSEVDVERVVLDEVQPRLDARDWSGAVVTMSDGLRSLAAPEEDEAGSPQWSATQTLAVVGGVAAVLLVAHLLSRRRSASTSSR